MPRSKEGERGKGEEGGAFGEDEPPSRYDQISRRDLLTWPRQAI